jgi:probable addiction module antidote protein
LTVLLARQKDRDSGYQYRAEARAVFVGERRERNKDDPLEYRRPPGNAGDVGAYLEAVFKHGDPELIGHALGSKGMTEIARRTGLGRQSLYKALLPEARPEFATVLIVVRALALKLTVTAA